MSFLLKYILCCFCFCSFCPLFAQQRAIDSLKKMLKPELADTMTINIYMELVQKYSSFDPALSIQYAEKALEKSQQIADLKREAKAYDRLGFVEWQRGNLETALKYYNKEIQLSQSFKGSAIEGNALLGIGSIYVGLGNHGLAIEYYHKALIIFEKIGQNPSIIRSMNNIGWQYAMLGSYDSAMLYLNKALPLAHKSKSDFLTNIYDNIGELYFLQKNYDKATPYLYKSLEFCRKFGNKRIELTLYRVLGEIDLARNNIDSAEYKINLSLEMALKLQAKRKIFEAYQALSKVMFMKKDFEKAYMYKENYVNYSDSLQNQNVKSALKIYDSERRQGELAVLKLENEKQANQRNWILFSALAGLSTLLVITTVILRSRNRVKRSYQNLAIANEEILSKSEEIKQQKEEVLQTLQTVNEQNRIIDKRNHDMTSSIIYARRIQTVLLPSQEIIQKHIPNLLLFYQPRDIVSGDFYWFSNTKGLRKSIIFAIADCTGHGVPGAFMTVIGNNLLDQIINKDKIFSPAQILTQLDKRLLKTLQQQTEKQIINDGMDISLIKLDLENGKLVWASAKRPLWVFENGKAEATEYKGSKFPIGSTQFGNKNFTETEIILQKGDLIYSFTDGYADQFGNEGKFTIGKFRQLIKAIHTQTLSEQEKILSQNLQKWQDKNRQTDDVLVVGIRV
ncbi:MAG: hypothetical protein EAZ97_02480 [Bacteroidetes bacterium]|nr:MAG: hypothetical protein EAZ97_02480 [Bacteroidota bacterium]